jgi:hypothetical protein
MHVLDYIMDRLSRLLRFNRYLLGEKVYSLLFHVVGLSLRNLSREIQCKLWLLGRVLGGGSIASQRYSLWRRGLGGAVAVDETVVKMHGRI